MTEYISIRQIIDNLMDSPLLHDLTLERAVNYAIRFIQIVGMPSIFEEKVSSVEIDNYRGQLPPDLYEVIQVRIPGNGQVGTKPSMLRYSTDSFHMAENKVGEGDLTYKIQGNCIFTTFKTGNVEIAYRAIMIDEEGFPLIPSNGTFETALELFIKKKHLTIQFELGKIQAQVLQHIEQEYAWAVGQAQSDLVRPTIDQLQSFNNSWNTLIQRTNSHSSGFRSNSI